MKDKELRKLIGSRIKQRRLELNLTQPYVAEKMGVTASTILRYENGSIDNTKKMVLEGLSEALHVSVEWLKANFSEKKINTRAGATESIGKITAVFYGKSNTYKGMANVNIVSKNTSGWHASWEGRTTTTSSSATSPCSSPTPPEPGWSICLLHRSPTGTTHIL